MDSITAKIKPITFNDCMVSSIEILDSAQKHYGDKSVEIFKNITFTLDNQKRSPDEVNNSREDIFKVASCTSFSLNGNEFNFRDTCFKLFPEEQSIQYFHGCQRNENQYKRFNEKMKKGFY